MKRDEQIFGVGVEPDTVVVVAVFPWVEVHGNNFARAGGHEPFLAAPHLRRPSDETMLTHDAVQLSRVIAGD